MNILTAPQPQFLNAVNEDVRDRSDNLTYEALRSPAGRERWANALKRMKRDTESQLANDKAERSEMRVTLNDDEWLQFVARQDRWRANSIRFKTGVENKLDEAMTLLRRESSFEAAVEQHRNSVLLGSDQEAETADKTLWEMLGNEM